MKTQHYSTKVLLALGLWMMILLSVPAVAVFNTSVNAQQQLPLQVAPVRQEFKVNPGEEVTFNVKFFNLGESPTVGFIKAADFIVNNDQGAPEIIDSADQISPRFSASGWITLPYDKVAIAPNDKITLQGSFTVPANSRPGGRYVAVYYEPNASLTNPASSPQEANSGLTARIASLLYIRVNGPIKESAFIQKIAVPTFLENGPIDIEAEILNRSDYHITPRGGITVRNMFGGYVDQEKINPKNIFPDTLREYTASLGRKWMFGKYDVTVNASYGEAGQVVERHVSVWVIPWKILLALGFGIGIIIYASRKMYDNMINKKNNLENEIEHDHEQIAKLKEELSRK